MPNINHEILFDNHSPNNPQLELLKSHFPNCFDKNGDFLIEKFSEIIQTQNINIQKEHYQFNWLGKSYAKILRELPPNNLLTADNEHNSQSKNQNSQNLLIQGDNLEVLKHLKNAYANAIKMIYIDPPYNTGSDGFVYQDDRKFTIDELMKLGAMDKDEAERVLNFTTKKSNSHSAWLTFMYPRLYVARELLKEDGVIFISIDDNEQAQLKILCDEVFGEENFVGIIPRITKKAGKTSDYIAKNHDYILIYSKSHSLKFIQEPHTDLGYKHTDEHYNERGRYKLSQTLDYSSIQYSQSLDYEIELNGNIFRAGNVSHDEMLERISRNPNSDFCWRWSKKLFDFGLKNDFIVIKGNRIYTKTYENATIEKNNDYYEIVYKTRTKTFSTLEMIENVYSNDNSRKDIEKIFNSKVFEYAKPVNMILKLLKIMTSNSDIILDFFAGSGTTAHAVMQLNTEDNGNRQFICVQLPELTDKKSEAYKSGYQTIFEITKARIQKASEKIQNDNPNYQGDLGFKIFKTTPDFRNLDNWDLNSGDLFNTTTFDNKQLSTLLTTWQVFDGFALTKNIQEIKLGTYTAYLIGQNLYLLNQDFNTLALKELLLKLDNDRTFCLDRIIFLGWHFDSTTQKELAQAINTYANKKSLNLTVLARY